MRNATKLALTLVSALALAGCSEKTQESAEQTVEAASQDVAGAASDAAAEGAAAVHDAATEGAAAINSAAKDAAGEAAKATGKLGEKIQEGAAKVEADAQNEPVEKANHD